MNQEAVKLERLKKRYELYMQSGDTDLALAIKKAIDNIEVKSESKNGEKKNIEPKEPATQRQSHIAGVSSPNIANNNSFAVTDIGEQITDETYLFMSKDGACEFQYFKEQLRGKLLNYTKKKNKSKRDDIQLEFNIDSLCAKLQSLIDIHGKPENQESLRESQYFFNYNNSMYKYSLNSDEIKSNFLPK